MLLMKIYLQLIKKIMDTTLLALVTSIAAALGIKEIWSIWKKRMDINADKDSDELQLSTKVFFATIKDLKDEIKALEEKIDDLIEKNTQCAIKLARLEERLMANAVKKVRKKTIKLKK
jgi:peptidoglycan hydrolase CwlO-like protein